MMKKYRLSIYLTSFALLLSFVLGYKDWERTSIFLLLFSTIYILFGRFNNYIERNKKYKEIIKDKIDEDKNDVKKTRNSLTKSLYLSALFLIIFYFIGHYLLNILNIIPNK